MTQAGTFDCLRCAVSEKAGSISRALCGEPHDTMPRPAACNQLSNCSCRPHLVDDVDALSILVLQHLLDGLLPAASQTPASQQDTTQSNNTQAGE